MTYATLKTDVIARSHRGDIASVVGTLIANAEAYLFRELQAVELEGEDTGTTTGSVIPLPAGFMAVQRLVIGGVTLGYENGTQTTTSVTTYPLAYTVEEGAIRLIDPVADGTAYALHYSAKLEALSDTNTTNWLLDNAKDLYMAAAMAEVGRHTRNQNLVAENTALIPGLIESVRSFSQRKKFPVRGGLQIKPRR